MRIDGRVAFVTGAGSGLGLATCRELHERGAQVVIVDRDAAKARELETELGANALAAPADVTDETAVQAAINAAQRTFGGLHICVNCAGVASAHKIVQRGEPAPLETFSAVLNVNLTGTFNVMRLAVAAMLSAPPDAAGERGVVINTSSAAAYEGQVGQVAYSASKAGVIGMTLPAARDLAGQGVRVVAIAPGLFHTAMFDTMPTKVQASLASMALEPPRLGEPAEFASLVRHIVENNYLNGTCIRIDAGARLSVR